MKTVRLTKDIEVEGLVVGDVMSVDELSAAAMVKRGVAEEYDAHAEEAQQATAAHAEYGGKPAATIDDIHDPEAHRDRRVQTVVRVGGPDPGPPRKPNAAQAPGDVVAHPGSDPVPAGPAPTEHKPRSKAAPGAKPVGGAAGGGDASS